MKLSTKLAIAMVVLASATAAAVGVLTYYNLEKAFLPRTLERIESDLRVATTELESYSGSVRADVEGFSAAVALNGIMRSHLAGGVDSEGISEAAWRERMASRFVAELRSKPGYLQFRIIGIDDGGREIVRAERSGTGEPRIAPDSELQRRGDRDYFKETIKLRSGEIYISPVELNEENGIVETPLLPVLRVATPVFAPDNRLFGIVIINIDMRRVFDRVRTAVRPGARVYVVNENGDYLLHPDPAREFGAEFGKPTRWQDDFPQLAAAAKGGGIVTKVINDEEDDAGGGGLSMLRLADGPSVGVIEVVSNAVIMAPALAVRDISLVVGLAAMICAAGLAAFVARSLAKPLVQITKAVDRFPDLALTDIPTGAGGEIGVLAKAFARVLGELRDKAAAFDREVVGHRETEKARESYEQQVRLFGAAVESSNDVIITNGLDGGITGWNAAAERLLGYAAAEVIGLRVEGFVPPDRQGEIQSAQAKILAGESIPTFESVGLARDGHEVDMSLSVSPIRLRDGKIVGGMVIGRDITEIKRTRAALRQGTEERRRIFETSQDLILVTDSQGNFVQVSPSSASILGYQPSEMVGHSATEFIYPDDLDSTRNEMRSARRGHMTRNFLTRYVHKDGRVVALTWMGTWSEPVKRHFFIGRDMTEILRAQDALQESERMARGIVNTALDAFMQMDEAGTIIDWNSQAEIIFGWSRREVVGCNAFDLIGGEREVDREHGFAGLLQSGDSGGGRFEIDARRRSGDEVRVELSVTAFQRSGLGRVFNIFIRDLTEKMTAEAQLRQSQKMDAVGQLTGGVAHDFNNILTVITGTIEILADAVADKPDLAAITQMIDEAATRGADLTRHLLAFARRQPLEPREIDVNTLIAEAGKLLRPTLGEHIEIVTMLADDPWLAFVDPHQLTNAVLNLAINARDAMPSGGKLTIETQNVELDDGYAALHSEVKPGLYVLLAISDTGIGIPPDRLEKVFEPFFTTKEVGKGTGLGLSMVYGFVKQTGGHIKIYSEEGHGTTVKLYIPRSTVQTPSLPGPGEIEKIVGGDELVLVVEDDELVRNYVVAQVKSLGYRTLAAANGRQALEIIRENPSIDLLFTDVIMAGPMNGRQLVDEALKLRPAIKTLYTSGYTENAIVHHGRLDPGVLLLAKPYRKSDLARMIRQALAVLGDVRA